MQSPCIPSLYKSDKKNYKVSFAKKKITRHDCATPCRGDIVAARACTVGKRSFDAIASSNSRLRRAWLPLSETRTELWPVVADTRQHASSFNPLPDPESRSAFLPLPAFPSNSPESYDFWGEGEREGTVDVWLCEGTGSFAFKRMSIVCFLNRRFLFFRKITLSSMILFSQTNVDAKLDIIIWRHTPAYWLGIL